MSTNSFINLDARFAFDLARRFTEGNFERADGAETFEASELAAKLLALAERVERMDAKIARNIEGDFAQGKIYGEKVTTTRSNLLRTGKKITDDEGETIIAALVDPERIRRVPMGVTAPKKPVVIDVTDKKSAPARTGFKLTDL